MANVIDRLLTALNAHDVEAAAALFDENYHSEQPAHPGRTFVGRAQMHANWKGMLAGIPDFRATMPRSVQDGDTVWSEWVWLGTRTDGLPFEARGVTLFQINDDLIVAGSLYIEEVKTDPVGIEEAIQELSGQRPQHDEIDAATP